MVDRNGVPLAVLVSAANVHDSMMFERPLEAVPPVQGPWGRPRNRPAKLHADKGPGAGGRRTWPVPSSGSETTLSTEAPEAVECAPNIGLDHPQVRGPGNLNDGCMLLVRSAPRETDGSRGLALTAAGRLAPHYDRPVSAHNERRPECARAGQYALGLLRRYDDAGSTGAPAQHMHGLHGLRLADWDGRAIAPVPAVADKSETRLESAA